MKYTPSHKSINILINDGSVSTEEIVNYIFLVSDLVGSKFPIENEFVTSPLYKIKPEFEITFNKIIDKLKNEPEK